MTYKVGQIVRLIYFEKHKLYRALGKITEITISIQFPNDFCVNLNENQIESLSKLEEVEAKLDKI